MDQNNVDIKIVPQNQNLEEELLDKDSIEKRISDALTLMYNQEKNDIDRFMEVSESINITQVLHNQK